MSRAALFLGAAVALAGGALSAAAEPNAFVQAYGETLAVSAVDVSIKDGLIPVSSDVQAKAYVEQRMPADQKARYEAFVATRTLTDDTAAERLAEFFTIDNIAGRLKDDGSTARRARLSIVIDQAKFPVMKLPGQVLPIKNTILSGSFRIEDAASGALLAEGRIKNSVAFVPDMYEAKKRNALKVLNFGRDDHLQVLAAAGNALARDAQAVFRDPALDIMSPHKIEGVRVQQASFEIRVSPPATSQEP
ncbi:hypothetical protein [Caulobacter endophyticus]|uniref:DUF2291 domain-containing protein n=1 Tax=Caulobacter endophyticus TaxID=2172652 RepID=A0A2T9K4N4_9CAUL|nr:hypothetical protein [Caulobacter endophyticus]PVM90938.1 hypothetical protein DDF67_08255 [Caulobacter endophyticus]